MTTPTNHYLVISTPAGKHVRGRVVYLQPNDERWQPQSAVVYIVSIDWLEPYGYAALYNTPSQSIQRSLGATVEHYSARKSNTI